MRTNRDLRNEWTRLLKAPDEYKIVIFMMFSDNILSLNVSLENEDMEMLDSECIMFIENTDKPTSEMLKKFRSLVKYFTKHFAYVQEKDGVIMV